MTFDFQIGDRVRLTTEYLADMGYPSTWHWAVGRVIGVAGIYSVDIVYDSMNEPPMPTKVLTFGPADLEHYHPLRRFLDLYDALQNRR